MTDGHDDHGLGGACRECADLPDVRGELQFRAERGDILCLEEHVAHTDGNDVWLECGDVELARFRPGPGTTLASEQWLRWAMDKHALDVATKLVRVLLKDGEA